ncbi:MAG TPA: OmpA family protein [Coleofasciculaceae cyanobacterium]
MTPSLTPQPAPPKRQSPPPAPGRGWGFLVLIFRLLLLGVGGSFAALAGIAVAQFHPAPPTQDPPWVEKVVQGSRSVWAELEQIPTILGLAPPAASPAPSASPLPAGTRSPAAQLSEADKQKLQADLTQLQNELTKLRDRPQISEDERAKQSVALEERIRTIQQQLNPTGFAAPMISPTPTDQPGVPPATSRVSGRDTLLVTLPVDALFSKNQTALQPGSATILDTILTDLQRYPGATIRIGAHSDNQGSEGDDRARTFEQAAAVEQYLATKLGKDYHWMVAGYGHSKPLANDGTDISRQRNRRIEIVIEPR